MFTIHGAAIRERAIKKALETEILAEVHSKVKPIIEEIVNEAVSRMIPRLSVMFNQTLRMEGGPEFHVVVHFDGKEIQ